MAWLIGIIALYFLWNSGALNNLLSTVAPSLAQQVAAPPSTSTAPINTPSSTAQPVKSTLANNLGLTLGLSATGSTGTASGSNVLTTPAQGGSTAGQTTSVVNGYNNNIRQRVNV
jgi:hypothetical protein